MSRINPVRQAAGIIFLAIFSLLSPFYSFFKLISLADTDTGKKTVAWHERRFADLKKKLPPYGTVGYAGEPTSERFDPDIDEFWEYILAQYSLAPLVVDKSLDHRYIIGNFYRAGTIAKFRQSGLAVIEDFGNGVMLLSNEGRKR
jgi:hypothetical protein